MASFPESLSKINQLVSGTFSLSSQHHSQLIYNVPCAYVDPRVQDECLKPGIQACSACRLVKYCSKECQRKHWKIHAKDCKDPVRSSAWMPAWVEEGRAPIFISNESPLTDPLSMGMSLWGNMPAINLLHIPPEEILLRPSIDVAFVASGDLRNLIRTVNSLPLNYIGHLTAVINDRNPFITLRNTLILQILGNAEDKQRKIDIALHLWYSIFLPHDYYASVLEIAAKPLMLGSNRQRVKLGERSNLEINNVNLVKEFCSLSCWSSGVYHAGDIADTYRRMRFNPSRKDYVHRRLHALNSSHRLALLKYFRRGLLLPFGAHDECFETPNRFLFSPDGKWLQADFATPTDGWDIEEVIRSGNVHGATRDDLFGCFYYHILDQLSQFVDRLAHLNITIRIFSEDAVELAQSITSNSLSSSDVPSTTRFDRIEVSNIMDLEYVGIPDVVDGWGRLLKQTKDATLVGYFMNWVYNQPEGQPNPKVTQKLVKKLEREGRLLRPSIDPSDKPDRRKMMEILGDVMSSYGEVDSVYDNSQAFDTFLRRNGLGGALTRNGLQRRLSHTVVPHRICAPLGAPPSALPEFSDKYSWYLQRSIAGPTWFERFVEIGYVNTV